MVQNKEEQTEPDQGDELDILRKAREQQALIVNRLHGDAAEQNDSKGTDTTLTSIVLEEMVKS